MAFQNTVLLLLFTLITSAITDAAQHHSPPSSSTNLGRRSLTAVRHKKNREYCDSWRFSVETNNAGKFTTVPSRCERQVKAYMNDGRYASDAESAAQNALTFAKNITLNAGYGNGKDAWVFDIDETVLSNLPYYHLHRYGSEAFNSTAFNEWTEMGTAPALPANLRLYNQLAKLGFKLFLLTGRSESFRKVTEKNLRSAGYTKWERLILRGHSDEGTKATIYKSSKRQELVNQGYKIHGNCGDQWSDLLGTATADRSFKVPNPMYYIS